MFFDYFDMLSGEPLFINDVGHIRSPLVRELCPQSGIGYRVYNIYLNFLSWDKKKLLEYDKCMKFSGAQKLNRDSFSAFDVATLLPQTRELYRGVLSFFMLEELVWDEKHRRYITFSRSEDRDVIGEINRNNFEAVRRAMLHLNFIGLDKKDAPEAVYSSDRTKELWELSQRYLKEQAENSQKEEKPEYKLSNIVSKVCAVHPSYNLLNVFDLTVFQLYDTFFQLGFMRSVRLNEEIFSNHGGDRFRFEDWLKPVVNNL